MATLTLGAPTHPVSLMRYPPELRCIIYDLLFSGVELRDYPLQKSFLYCKMPARLLRRGSGSNEADLVEDKSLFAILQTSHAIRSDAYPILFKHLTMCILGKPGGFTTGSLTRLARLFPHECSTTRVRSDSVPWS